MHLAISLSRQRLELIGGPHPFSAPISSGAAGIGSEENSGKTPVGHFRIHSKHGENAPADTVFRGRLPQCRTSPQSADSPPPEDSDAILARILTLDGQEPGNANTLARYIYIHGTAHTRLLGRPASHGCIRMAPDAIIELYPLLPIGTDVFISQD